MDENCNAYGRSIEPKVSVPTYRCLRAAVRVMPPLVLSVAFHTAPVFAQEYFNPHALELRGTQQQTVNLDQFARQGQQIPGTYRVDIYMNDNRIGTRPVEFVSIKGSLKPRLTVAELAAMGVKQDALPLLKNLPDTQVLDDVGQYIPDASSKFDFSRQRLDISIPQAALNSEARGFVDPSQWDQGLPALLINYNVSGASSHNADANATKDSQYVNLRSGANLGAWRLRNYSTYSHSSDENHWDNVNTFLQRDIQFLRSQMTLGDSSTPGDVFDSVQFRGAQLASDDNMYPDSLKGFAPVVRGIAQSNAQVTVRQNGYIIYQTYVPPGAFAITDLYPTAASGDMEVTITEADGTARRFVQSFSAVPIMLRAGRMKYAVAAGQYRTLNSGARTPRFGQGSLIYGLPYDWTAYGGLLTSENYSAFALGMGHGFGRLGSVSMDVTQASTELRNGSSYKGLSYRIQYAKSIEATNTSFTLAGYRYSTKGFYDFQEANEVDSFSGNLRSRYNKRSKTQVNLSQSLGSYGNLYLSGYQQDFWLLNGYERSLSAGYNLSYNDMTYGLSFSYSQSPNSNDNDRQLAFTLQIPLSKWLPNSWASYSANGSKKGNVSQQVGLNGTALADNNLSYNIQQNYGNKGTGGSGNVNANYKGTYGEVTGGYNYAQGSRQLNYGLQGGIVAHPYGVTFSQQQGDTLALVRAPGASGAKVENNTGVYTDWRGYAVVPYVNTYRQNRIAIDTGSLGDDVDIDTNAQRVTPTLGALVLANFHTRVGSRVLMTLSYQGKPVPFGATVALVQADQDALPNTGIVSEQGQVYLSGVPESGQLWAKWGRGDNQQCRTSFRLPAVNNPGAVRTLAVVCQPS